ncbi:MAG TPA: NEW3 domain-containing protein [Terriglobia bacterium]|nr:NEW3 domain-containing protein [Terriglobia bacterium]
MRPLLKTCALWALLPILLPFPALISAQSSSAGAAGPSANTEAQRLLELKRIELSLNEARAKRDRQKTLFDGGVGARADYESAEIAYRQAQVDFQQAFLRLFSQVPRLDIVSAIKYQRPDGSKYVRVTVRNNSGAVLDYKQFGILAADVQLPSQLQMRELTDIRVSLKEAPEISPAASAGSPPVAQVPRAVISDPYSAYISKLEVGEQTTLNFELLKDVDALTVGLYYNGREADQEVYLEKDPSANIISISSEEVSLEADLGASASYNLHLEQFTKSSQPFSLLTLNLPPEINTEFLEPSSGAHLSQVRFPEGVTSQNIQLKIYLPDKVDDRVRLDQPLNFWVLVMDPAQAGHIDPSKTYSESQIAALKCGKVRLQLIPRGIGRIEVTAPSLYQEIAAGKDVILNLTVKNIGTRVVRNIHLSTETPLNWRTVVAPDTLDKLDPNEESIVKLQVLPPAGVGLGDYEVRIKTDATSNSRKLQMPDQSDRIHIITPPNLAATGLLVAFLVLVIGGIVWFGVRMARR